MHVPRETLPFPAQPLIDYLLKTPVLLSWFGGVNSPTLTNVHLDLVPFLFSTHPHFNASPIVLSLEQGLSPTYLSELFSAVCVNRCFSLAPTGVPSHSDVQSLSLFFSSNSGILLVPEQIIDLWHITTTPNNHKPTKPISIQAIKYQRLMCLISQWEYVRTASVFGPGSFSVRGGVLDVFFYGHPYPVRLEYRGDQLVTARSFDPVSQRKLQDVTPSSLSVLPRISFSVEPNEGASIRHFISQRAALFRLSKAGGSEVITVEQGDTIGASAKHAIDLGCIPLGPFNENWAAFEADVTRVHGSSAKFLFLPPSVRSAPHRGPLLTNFTSLSFPARGSFYSGPLSLLSVSLNSLYRRARLRPTLERIQDETSLAPSRPVFNWAQPLVHEDLGIGLYRGLSIVKTSRGDYEAVDLEYAHGDYVHLPMERLHLVHPFVGSDNEPPALSSLRNSRWMQLKQRTRRSAEKVVQEFLDLYASRHEATGFSFSGDSELHARLAESFPYEETRGQLAAYEDVCTDMERSKPMDRLLCGDVGFGKTEIAIRAAFKAVFDKKQVAILVPTTLLANQHFLSFKSRLEPLGVRVALLSRFTKTKMSNTIMRAVEWGKVDVIIGTHRLLSKNLSIPSLGLLIIDEEHRFGAKHKERLKVVRSSADVLTLSATPIPRTLQFSLLGIRDISTISTPPKERFPVISVSCTFSKRIIRDATLKEAQAGGQSFFIHNKVKTIAQMARRLQDLLPDLRVGVAHGQLSNVALETVMLNFLDNNIDLLVCSTIIEAGMDIPRANTIFINDAHHFGLAQLYQMRGRVGRGDRQAFCYLLTPKKKNLSAAAAERLRNIQDHTSLGSGYALALQDLQMRGAGNLFGVEQAGHLASVGHHLYYKLVEEISNKRFGRAPSATDRVRTTVSGKGNALLPSGYVPDVGDRLYFYRRLGEADTVAAVDDVFQELQDRFGPLPGPAKVLLNSASIQVRASAMGIQHINFLANGVSLSFRNGEESNESCLSLKNLTSFLALRNLSGSFGSAGGGRLELTIETSSDSESLSALDYLFESF